ncbi:MAG: hypothetical protein KBC16_00430 [Candidatus Pacebacteria bacterium]|nr:hypothetical protein [Candidatus Paceibacterota bacterium]
MKKNPTLNLKEKTAEELTALRADALKALKESRVALHDARFAGFGARTKDSNIARKTRRDIARAMTLKTQVETAQTKLANS